MSQRVQNAKHLGLVLAAEPRTDIAGTASVRAAIDTCRASAQERRRGAPDGAPSEAPDGAGQPFRLHEFQEEFVQFAIAMREHGLPYGQP
jgi:hypothetical protein